MASLPRAINILLVLDAVPSPDAVKRSGNQGHGLDNTLIDWLIIIERACTLNNKEVQDVLFSLETGLKLHAWNLIQRFQFISYNRLKSRAGVYSRSHKWPNFSLRKNILTIN